MGFFSWTCKVCGHSIIPPEAATKLNRWMTQAVVLLPDGSILKGTYDGYGRVASKTSEHEFVDSGQDPEMYHRACWELAGKPTEFTEPSDSASDQGFFFNHEHDFPKPATLEDAKAIRPARQVSSIEWLKSQG